MDWDDFKDIIINVLKSVGILVLVMVGGIIIGISEVDNGIERIKQDPVREFPKVIEEIPQMIESKLHSKIQNLFHKNTKPDDLSATKDWPSIQLKTCTVYLRTVWMEGQLYYQFYMVLTPQVSQLLGKERKTGSFYIDFENEDGFKLSTVTLSVESMVSQNDKNGNISILSIKDSTYLISADIYKKASRWDISWSGSINQILSNTLKVEPKPKPEPIVQQKSFFTIGSTKNEVLVAQGQPTALTAIMWWYEGSWVSFDGKGLVTGWGGENLNAKVIDPE